MKNKNNNSKSDLSPSPSPRERGARDGFAVLAMRRTERKLMFEEFSIIQSLAALDNVA
jgi:hypothetical protein